MEQSVRNGFDLADRDVRAISSLSLAFLGDAVYELVIRTLLVETGNERPKALNRKKARLAQAGTQADMAEYLLAAALLSPEEEAVYRRGRNADPPSMARHASAEDYRKATGFESLMGWLYLTGKEKRAVELVRLSLEEIRRRGRRQGERNEG